MTLPADQTSQQGNSGTNPSGAVSESELIALKRSLETKLKEAETKLVDVERQLGVERAARTAAEQAIAKVKEYETQVAELSGTNQKLTEQVTQFQTKLLDTRRVNLVNQFKLKPETVKALDESQLNALEAVLPGLQTAQPATPAAKGLDLSTNGGRDFSSLSAMEKIKAGLELTK